jgi:multiple sugar transport system permease protein
MPAAADTSTVVGEQTAAPPPRRRGRSRRKSPITTSKSAVLLFLSPLILGIAIFKLYPIAAGIYYSMTDFHVGSYQPVRFVGLDNYRHVLSSSSDAWTAGRNTLWLLIFLVPAQTLWAMFVAWLVLRIRRGRTLFRTIFFLPAMVPLVASALAFVVLLNPAGPLNHALSWVGIDGPGWFGDPSWAKPSLVIVAMWGCGKIMILFVAGMLNVPRSLYEAAEIDGASAWRQFWHITLPGISPVTFFAVITGMIATFQYFTEAYVISASSNNNSGADRLIGYPQNSTLFATSEIYKQGFVFFKTGYASAIAVLVFLAVFVCTIVFIWGTRRSYGYGGESQ